MSREWLTRVVDWPAELRQIAAIPQNRHFVCHDYQAQPLSDVYVPVGYLVSQWLLS